ncbi:hypothetical protein [Telmatospirillum sp. J64-1]|uniref:hypothetical protein n=1 Tax=Telmatospirillum sp. J64-1 TaxID=2502183 RepID=UPI00115DACBA|nr:hypothetical protein [Telmatospirillum sp. J64-1]
MKGGGLSRGRRLSDAQEAEMLRLYADGKGWNRARLAKRYGLRVQAMSGVLHRARERLRRRDPLFEVHSATRVGVGQGHGGIDPDDRSTWQDVDDGLWPLDVASCRGLACSVIRQALHDAMGLGAVNRWDARSAQEWFKDGGRDFRQWCWSADLDPDVVRSNALRLIAQAELRGNTHADVTAV